MQEKLTNDEIKNIVVEMQIKGHEVSVRDIAYVFLRRFFDSKTVAYRAVFESEKITDNAVSQYEQSNKIEDLTQYLDKEYPENTQTQSESEGLSFDEIKRGLEDDLKSLISLRDRVDEEGNSLLDAKEMANVVGRIADIRVKLTEKFGTTVQSEEQRVVVIQKFNDVCPYCRHEIAVRK